MVIRNRGKSARVASFLQTENDYTFPMNPSRLRLAFGLVPLLLAACTQPATPEPGKTVEQPITQLPISIEAPERIAKPPFAFSAEDEQFLDEVQRGCFNYFWNGGRGPAKLVPDRTSIDWVSMAGVGFQLGAFPVGVERGWAPRAEAEARAIAILDLVTTDPRIQHGGLFQHFISPFDGGPHGSATLEVLASTIDSAIFISGAITAASYFGGEVAQRVDGILDRADWKRFVVKETARHDYESDFISLGWKPDDPANFTGSGSLLPFGWVDAGCEHRLVTFLAVCASRPEHRVDPTMYYRLRRGLGEHPATGPVVFFPYSGAIFTTQFSHLWIPYAALGADDPAALGVGGRVRVDWWENSRRHTVLHQVKCRENPKGLPNLGRGAWGLSASDIEGGYGVFGVYPTPLNPEWMRTEWDYPTYVAKDDYGDGTIAPYAAGSAVMFDPRGAIDALRYYRELGARAPGLWEDPWKGGWGFADSFRVRSDGTVWVGKDHLPIDHGPMLLAIENARTGLVWKLFEGHPAVKAGMERLKMR
jgi:hypothetical protein